MIRRLALIVLLIVQAPLNAQSDPPLPPALEIGGQSGQLNHSQDTGRRHLRPRSTSLTPAESTNSENGIFRLCCDIQINENESPATITVSRLEGSTGAVSVNFITGEFEQTAQPGEDYRHTSGTLNWADGDTADKTINVVILDDFQFEGFESEYFWIDIKSPTGGATIDPEYSYVAVDILDDEPGPPGVSIDSFTATPATISPGQISTISWSVSNADQCIATAGTNGWDQTEITLPSGSAPITFIKAGNFPFGISCTNEFSGKIANTTVVVEGAPAVKIDSFSADPTSIQAGQSTTVSWAVSNATECTASEGAGGWAGSPVSLPSGSAEFTLPETGDFTFTLHCINASTADESSFDVDVTEMQPAAEINSFMATPSNLFVGESTTVEWFVSNADNCTASGNAEGWAGTSIELPTGGTSITLFETGDFELVLECMNASSSTSESITVGVFEPNDVVIDSFTASPDEIIEGQSTTLSWTVANATECTAVGGAGAWAGSPLSLPSGELTLSLPDKGNHLFQIHCSNDSGSPDNDSVLVTVKAPSTEEVTLLVPIEPCRISDSRKAGGPFGNETTLNLRARGDGLAGQGGSDDCGIPDTAVAIHVNFTAVNPTGFGYLRAWPFGEDEPLATLMVFNAGPGISNATALTICNDCPSDFSVKIYGAVTDLVTEVVAYYQSE
jgi:hypothetical protein